ncbi:MAG: HAMP domain-containing protein [Bdellovibrionaceae bacterium]|nr:HAMP domain-containing protein [Pseudobdellovibrionaceae bacterium]
MANRARRKPSRSLRTILIVWFLLFSVVPLAFVTGYSVFKYEKAIDHELSQRLAGNGREVSVILTDFKTTLQQRRDRYLADPGLVYHLSTGDGTALRSLATTWIRSDLATSLTFFTRTGRMITSVFKDERGEVRDFNPAAGSALYLSKQNIEKLKNVKEYSFAEHAPNQKLSLITFTKVVGKSGRVVGYLEQLIDLDKNFLEKLQERMKLELIFLKAGGQVTVGTHPDFALYKKEFFQEKLDKTSPEFFELHLRGEPYGFIFYPLQWGNTDFFIAMGASKGEAIAVLKNVNYAFYTVVGAIILLLIITILFTSNAVLKPLNDLLEAIQNMQQSDQPVEIPIKSETEIGLLAESFNLMSRNVSKARTDLKAKINELEKANQELRETQSRLVHSSKMVSLGQLVAGVAHELNNPIGFIYSNMSHLSDYAGRLIKLAEAAERNPQSVGKLIQEYDLEYIKKDLPKLISSCEDGARRTRDIVLGLRNFSRLEEAKLKEIDLHEALDNTLNLLAGELKNRVQIHRQYGSLPLVSCFASQINQVFMNILSNAAQAIETNGNIWIATKTFTSSGGKPMVQVSIQDSGKGMTAQIIEKIFDPFFSTKGVGQGTGLGLSISYGIVQNHGGDIQVKSQVGIGTEFIVTIPVKADPPKNLDFFS